MSYYPLTVSGTLIVAVGTETDGSDYTKQRNGCLRIISDCSELTGQVRFIGSEVKK